MIAHVAHLSFAACCNERRGRRTTLSTTIWSQWTPGNTCVCDVTGVIENICIFKKKSTTYISIEGRYVYMNVGFLIKKK